MNASKTTGKHPADVRAVLRLYAWAKSHRVLAFLAFCALVALTVMNPALTLAVLFVAWLWVHSTSALIFGALVGLVLWAMSSPPPF